MSKFIGETLFLQGYVAAIRDVRKELWEICRLKKTFDLRTVDSAVKDLLKNINADAENVSNVDEV